MADRRVAWTNAARDDLRAIAFHVARDSLDNALRSVDRLEHRAATLAQMSTRGRIVPELRRVAEQRHREVIEKPWRILYRVEESLVSIVAVVDGRRDVQAWLNEHATRFRASRP